MREKGKGGSAEGVFVDIGGAGCYGAGEGL